MKTSKLRNSGEFERTSFKFSVPKKFSSNLL
jgi:hypothetical protein